MVEGNESMEIEFTSEFITACEDDEGENLLLFLSEDSGTETISIPLKFVGFWGML